MWRLVHHDVFKKDGLVVAFELQFRHEDVVGVLHRCRLSPFGGNQLVARIGGLPRIRAWSGKAAAGLPPRRSGRIFA